MPVSDHLNALRDEIESCEKLRQHAKGVSDAQTRAMIYESILLRAFRVYENFVERIFLSYLVGEVRQDGFAVTRFALPHDQEHARRMLSSSAGSRFLDWSDPSTVRERCNVFFERDNPVYLAIGGKEMELMWMKKVRNHVAHNSATSASQFCNVLQAVLLTSPQPTPAPGSFLQRIPAKGPVRGREVLAYFLDTVDQCSKAAAGVAAKQIP